MESFPSGGNEKYLENSFGNKIQTTANIITLDKRMKFVLSVEKMNAILKLAVVIIFTKNV